jgi:hypothetical protein
MRSRRGRWLINLFRSSAHYRSGWARQGDAEGCAFHRSSFDRNLASMVLDDLLHYRQTQTGAIFFSQTDKWFKQCIPD